MPNKLNLKIAEELKQRVPKDGSYLVVGYGKLTGQETTELRRTLRSSKITVEVVKNSIAARALKDNGMGAGASFLQGPSALVVGECEMPQMCKIVTEVVKKYEERFFVRGGAMGDMALTPAAVVQLASIPPLPVLQARFIGSVQAPIARMAGAFQSIARSLACALEAIREQKEKTVPSSAPQEAASGAAPAAS